MTKAVRLARGPVLCRLRPLAGLALSAVLICRVAMADPLRPDDLTPAASPGWTNSLSRSDGIVTVPSWVSLVGAGDTSRYGSAAEGIAADGRLAVSYGETNGLDAATAGNTAPSLNPEDRRTVNMRADGDSIAGSTISISTGLSESREAVIDAASPSDFGDRRRTAAGAGAVVGLLDGRIRVTGEFAGARLDQPTTAIDGTDDGSGVAHRVRAEIVPLHAGGIALSAALFHGSADPGYAIAGPAAPDSSENGAGTRMSFGPVTLGLDGAIRRNNLEDDPDVTTRHDQVLQPSVGLSLDPLRRAVGSMFPSAIRFASAVTRRSDMQGRTDAADAMLRSDSATLDWSWNAATRTSLGFALDRTNSSDSDTADPDGDGRGVSLSHAISGRDLVTTMAVALHQTDSDDPANPGRAAFADLSAAIASRHGPFGGMIASFLVHHAQGSAAEAGDGVDTTWRAKAAFELAALPAAQPGDGRLTMAVSFNGNTPEPDGAVVPVDMVVGLAAQMRF